jgi:hypothetical protein
MILGAPTNGFVSGSKDTGRSRSQVALTLEPLRKIGSALNPPGAREILIVSVPPSAYSYLDVGSGVNGIV